jgi:quinol-cytochrome oxidoreductase complex cytochrome b subunit
VNRQEKEAYLREYSLLKAQGKPFFPYAVAKDGLMGCVVIGTIIVMAIVLGAELGPKADPTTTTYTPRPEWYFFFLFELLRVVKPPELVFVATIVAMNINGTGPLVGPYLSDFLLGGPEFNATTLSRFYSLHMMLVPGLIAALIGAHLYLVAKLGTTAPPWLKAEDPQQDTRKVEA